MNILLQIFVAVAMMVISALLMPKQKPTRTETSPGEEPTASAGRSVPVLFGTMRIKDANCLWFGDAHYIKTEVDA